MNHVQKPTKDSLYIEHIGKFEDGESERSVVFLVSGLSLLISESLIHSFSDHSVEIVVDEDKRRLHARYVVHTVCPSFFGRFIIVYYV